MQVLLTELTDLTHPPSVIFYGESFTLETYKHAYENDVAEVITHNNPLETESLSTLQNKLAVESGVTPLTLQNTTFSVAQSLMSAADDELDTKIDWALESLGEALGAAQCIIYDCSSPSQNIVKQYAWENTDKYAAELNQQCKQVSVIGNDSIPESQFPGYDDVLTTFNPVCYNEHCDEITKEFTRQKGTFLAIPIVIDWELHSIFVIRTAVPQYWTDEVQIQLESIAELIIHTTRRRMQRQELQRQNQQLEQFNSVISHDLQNPLSVAKGYVQLTIDTEELHHLDTAADAIIRMEDMINELLSLARQGEEIGDTEMVQLTNVLTQAEKHVTVPNGQITYSEISDEYMIECDPSRLRELFENLFRNAVDHAGDNVLVTVSVTSDDEIIVADNGPGIPPEKREQIFEHGYTDNDGTGFGLAIVNRIVSAHGWDIKVTESDTGGAAFHIITNI
jgi:K+-sensing histidine kinase KdpD